MHFYRQIADGHYNFSACWQRKVQDLWVGVFWKVTKDVPEPVRMRHKRRGFLTIVADYRFEAWICFLPCLPLHITITKFPVIESAIDPPGINDEVDSEDETEDI